MRWHWRTHARWRRRQTQRGDATCELGNSRPLGLARANTARHATTVFSRPTHTSSAKRDASVGISSSYRARIYSSLVQCGVPRPSAHTVGHKRQAFHAMSTMDTHTACCGRGNSRATPHRPLHHSRLRGATCSVERTACQAPRAIVGTLFLMHACHSASISTGSAWHNTSSHREWCLLTSSKLMPSNTGSESKAAGSPPAAT
jgi:hypothetical protein